MAICDDYHTSPGWASPRRTFSMKVTGFRALRHAAPHVWSRVSNPFGQRYHGGGYGGGPGTVTRRSHPISVMYARPANQHCVSMCLTSGGGSGAGVAHAVEMRARRCRSRRARRRRLRLNLCHCRTLIINMISPTQNHAIGAIFFFCGGCGVSQTIDIDLV